MRKVTLAIVYATLLVSLAATARAAPPVLFLDRCAAGCAYGPGFDDSRTNTSNLSSGISTLSAFAHGDASFDAVVACVRDTFAPFAIEVTDVDPGAPITSRSPSRARRSSSGCRPASPTSRPSHA